MTPRVAVDELKPGMYIQLDLRWWQHPFARSAFKLQDASQIATLRELGLREVSWVPELSELTPTAPATLQAGRCETKAPSTASELPAQPAPVPADPGHRHRLAQQAAERRLVQARQAWRHAAGLVLEQPEQALVQLQPWSEQMVQDLADAPELNLRVLDGAGGDVDSVHAVNVSVLSLLLGRACGLQVDSLQELALGALLHDIGKQALPKAQRHLCAHPSRTERLAWQDHVTLGQSIGKRLGLSPAVLQVLAQHHERADGQGFPQGLALQDQALPARIVALADAFDLLCHPAAGQQACTPHEALAHLYAKRRGEFDPALLNTLIRGVGVYPPGSVVQLSDERFAVVATTPAGRALKPTVLAAPALETKTSQQPQLLELEHCPQLSIRRCLLPAQLPAWARACLAPCRRLAYLAEAAWQDRLVPAA